MRGLGLGLGLSRRVSLSEAGGVPEWLPEGATAFLDFVNGHYYIGGAVRTLSEVIKTDIEDPDLSNWDGLEFSADGFGNVEGPLRSSIKSGLSVFQDDITILVEQHQAATSSTVILWWYLSHDYSTYIETQLRNAGSYLYQIANDDELDFSATISDQINKSALTVTATKFSASVNGANASTTSKQSVLLSDVVDFQLETGGGEEFIRSITVYPTQDDGDLPILSALT